MVVPKEGTFTFFVGHNRRRVRVTIYLINVRSGNVAKLSMPRPLSVFPNGEGPLFVKGTFSQVRTRGGFHVE